MFDVNQYFDGKVKSIAFETDTLPATIGVMAPGDYEFATDSFETMTVVSGEMKVKLPDTNQWQIFGPSQQFAIEANQRFNVKVTSNTTYLCTYG